MPKMEVRSINGRLIRQASLRRIRTSENKFRTKNKKEQSEKNKNEKQKNGKQKTKFSSDSGDGIRKI